MNFTKQQKLIGALLLLGTFLFGIALGEWLIDEVLEVRYDHTAHVMFGMFGLVFVAGAFAVRILLEPKDR